MTPPGALTTTDWILAIGSVSFLILVFGFDAWLLQKKGEAQTFSARIAFWAERWPISVAVAMLVIGILIGHLYYPNHAYCP